MGISRVDDYRIGNGNMDYRGTATYSNSSKFSRCDERHSVKVLNKRIRIIWSYLADESGNVESAMVIIPLLVLFLIGAQLIVTTNMRSLDMAITQSHASQQAITGVLYATDEVIDLNSSDAFEKIRVLVTHKSRAIPQLLPNFISLMSGTPRIDVSGIAVMEKLP
jgi:hypothetical protein